MTWEPKGHVPEIINGYSPRVVLRSEPGGVARLMLGDVDLSTIAGKVTIELEQSMEASRFGLIADVTVEFHPEYVDVDLSESHGTRINATAKTVEVEK